MLRFIRENKLAAALLLVGLVCALVLCSTRAVIESGNRLVCVVMTQEDAQELSFVPKGLRLWSGGETLDGSVLLVEDENQYSHIAMSEHEYEPGNSVRCFKLTKKYAARYATLGYSGAEEIENILYRAVTDRNIRVVWLTPFTDSATGNTVTDGAVYEQVIQNLGARIAPHGLSLTDGEFSVVADHNPNEWLLCGVLLGILGAALAVIDSLLQNKKLSGILFLLFCAGLALLVFVLSPRVAGLSLTCACVFPCLSVVYAVRRLALPVSGGLGKKIGAFCGCILPAFVLALVGGLFVAALQSSEEYLLAVYNFRGVKLSQLVPLGFAAVYLCVRFYGKSGINDILSGKKTLIVLLVIALVGALAVFLMRTGDGILSVGVLEQRLRNALERTLIARPRTKEFLIAWPCLALACALANGGGKRLVWPFAVISTVGFSSVVNTFCHSRAPIWLSSVRSVLGLIIGLALGIAVICIADLFRTKNE